MASVPLLDDFGDEFDNTSENPDKLRHPYVIFFHILFRSAAIIVYLFCTMFTDSFITSFVFVVLLLSADFWSVKNITGRILVGLRWWNYIDEEGKSIWVYESREKSQMTRHNAREVRLFWTALIVAPIVWVLFLLVAFFGLKFKWMLLVLIALTLNTANLHGYVKCKFGSNQSLKDGIKSFGQRELLRNFLSRTSQSPPVNQPNSTGVV